MTRALLVTSCLGCVACLLSIATSCTGPMGPQIPPETLSQEQGAVFMRGVVGEILDIENDSSLTRWDQDNAVQFAGDVPHQTQESTVFINVRIANTHLFDVGETLHQDGVRDTWTASEAEGPVFDVYVCPNGEGVSGFADDITITRTGDRSFVVGARSTTPEQNLDVDVDVTPIAFEQAPHL